METSEAIWQEVEYGDYAADLPLWEELAESANGPIIELGCGVGRVIRNLGGSGKLVRGIDRDPVVASFAQRLGCDVEPGDVRDFEVAGEFALALAPLQLIQLLANSAERIACLTRVARALRSRGLAAFAIDERLHSTEETATPPCSDVRMIDGWLYSSLPLKSQIDRDSVVLRRLRQAVTPDGKLGEKLSELRLHSVDAETLEREALKAGLRPVRRRSIPGTETHVGSTAVLLEAGRE